MLLVFASSSDYFLFTPILFGFTCEFTSRCVNREQVLVSKKKNGGADNHLSRGRTKTLALFLSLVLSACISE